MEVLRRLIVGIVGLAVGVLVNIAVMIWGWGIQPKNLWVIVGLGVFGMMFAIFLVECAKSKE